MVSLNARIGLFSLPPTLSLSDTHLHTYTRAHAPAHAHGGIKLVLLFFPLKYTSLDFNLPNMKTFLPLDKTKNKLNYSNLEIYHHYPRIFFSLNQKSERFFFTL